MNGLDKIMKVVAQVFKVEAGELIRKGRDKYVVNARKAFIYQAYNSQYTMEAIGQFLSGRDHSSISHNYKEACAIVDTNQGFRNQIFKIKMVLENDLEFFIEELPTMDQSDLEEAKQLELAITMLNKAGLNKAEKYLQPLEIKQ